MTASIQPTSPIPGRPRQWIYCLPAYGVLVHRLPLLYKIVEGHDVVGIELRLSTGASFEVLWITKAGDDQVAVSVSLDLYRRSEQPSPDHLSYAATKLDSDLQWAATRDCAEQGHELLLALTGFRGLVIEQKP
jgi:hypothetical protein